ncbi:ATP-dependent RNA helicase RhlB [Pseudohongiella nitratireducens]|uniref:ATP-dependent RNA helicase RhlB n=1 Tax=Pseudohongiella nitratireducens TaxID=1768907 RepID=UPI002409D00E|nr:ATP-dependent RNA helicase RhlB [Pseudohongiella nitratireducens]MDF1624272.1 ATP-dependent RNA helicase RhlB [Pseudohongiella nitratireducens]
MPNSDNDSSNNDAQDKSVKQDLQEETQQTQQPQQQDEIQEQAPPEAPQPEAGAEEPVVDSEPVAEKTEQPEQPEQPIVADSAAEVADEAADVNATADVNKEEVAVAKPAVQVDAQPEQNIEATVSASELEPAFEEKVIAPKVAFSEFDLQPELAKAIEKMGFTHCTPIQAQSLRYTLRGYDVTGKAQTGTGKTAAFLITLINDMLKNPIQGQRYAGEPRAIVLAPTRELVIQIASDADLLCHGSGLNVITMVGGEDYAKQLKAVDKGPVDIVVATPGRLIDFLQHEHLYLGLVELLVIDEADRMLDMGFIPQVRNIVARTPHKDCRQTLLFSATFTPEILELTSRWAMDPVMIEIEPERVATDMVEQIVYLVTSEDKYKLLYNLVSLQGSEKVIIFSNRRDQVRKLADSLYRNGIECGMLSGEVAQKKRIKTLEDFRTGKTKVLVATDVAGRGLHIDDVTHVINYTLPEEAEDYVHRIGRTGRAGASGTSISFACEEDSFLLPNIEEKLGEKLRCVHPDHRLLADAPEYSRASHFKEDDKAGKSGRSSGKGAPRSRSGSRSRSRRS